MPTMRQQQRAIGQWLAGRGFSIHDAGDGIFLLRNGGRDTDNAPFEVHEQFRRWCVLQDQRMDNCRSATPAEIEEVDDRLVAMGYPRLDDEQRAALSEGGEEADSVLDDLQARVGIFTDDISAAMLGEDPSFVFDGTVDLDLTRSPGFKPVLPDLPDSDDEVEEGNRPAFRF